MIDEWNLLSEDVAQGESGEGRESLGEQWLTLEESVVCSPSPEHAIGQSDGEKQVRLRGDSGAGSLDTWMTMVNSRRMVGVQIETKSGGAVSGTARSVSGMEWKSGRNRMLGRVEGLNRSE